jgi:acetyl esterase/lipase
MKTFILFLALTSSAVAQATKSPSAVGTAIPSDAKETVLLWPNGAPGAVGDTFDDQPKLWCYPASGPGPHTAVILLPGGGYNHLVTEQEGAWEARWLNKLGISAYVLQYRLGPRYLYPIPQMDGQRAVRYVRAHASEWNLKPDSIGVWGFSAGGHLAGFLATANPVRHRISRNRPIPSTSFPRIRISPSLTMHVSRSLAIFLAPGQSPRSPVLHPAMNSTTSSLR